MITFQAEQLGLLPGNITQPSCIRCNVEEHCEQDDRRPRGRVVRALDERASGLLGEDCHDWTIRPLLAVKRKCDAQ